MYCIAYWHTYMYNNYGVSIFGFRLLSSRGINLVQVLREIQVGNPNLIHPTKPQKSCTLFQVVVGPPTYKWPCPSILCTPILLHVY